MEKYKDLIPIIKQAECNGFKLGEFCLKFNISYTGLYDGVAWCLLSKNLVDLLLLDKDFNKAFWGSYLVDAIGRIYDYKMDFGQSKRPKHFKYKWEYSLQQLVLKDNKIEYFKRGLKS